jgi:transcriptional regulator with XRE-family HTH domain
MKTNDTYDREDRLAEERFILATQVAIQDALIARGLKYRDLGARLGVSEARISQLMGDEALNLTVRTVGRIFHRLGEQAVIMTKRDFERALSGSREDDAGTWEFLNPSDMVFDVEQANDIVLYESSETAAERNEWAAAEAVAMKQVA